MRLFRRSSGTDPDRGRRSVAITEFWSWWSTEGATRVATALTDQTVASLADELSTRVHAINSGLAWELAAGTTSDHLLVVTAEGNPALRADARRWLRKAPVADARWQYADLRQPVPDPEGTTLGIDGETVDFAGVSVAARRQGYRLDVTLHHPRFDVLPEQVRKQVAFLALDATLGEADTEVWIGEVRAPEVAPLDGFGLSGLRAVIGDLRDSTLDEDGRPIWVVLRGQTPDGPVLALARVPLAPVLHPHLDQHVAVVVPYTDRTEEGLPGPGSLDELRRFEDHLSDRLESSGILVAHQSHQGVRTLHFYVDSSTPAAAQLEAAVSGWTQGKVGLSAQVDPAWSAVAPLRT